MGLGSIMAGLGGIFSGGLANAIGNAVKDKNKNNSTSGGGSSGGGASSNKGSGGASNGFNGSAAEYDRLESISRQLADQWHQTNDLGEQKSLHDQAVITNKQLGKTYDSSTGTWSGGYARPEEQTAAQQYQDGFDEYRDYMDQSAAKQQAAIQAGVDQAVNDLNAQKGDVGKQTAANNAAAERAYMQTVKPNGSLAESLAANGLLTSGLTETSQISAGNEYQNALNSNATTQTEAIAEIERAITQARLSGDLEAAQALAGLLEKVANVGYQNVQNIVEANRWQQEFDYNKGVTDAGLTGIYNGVLTVQGQAAKDEHILSQLSAESQRIATDIQKKTGMTLAELQIEALRLQNKGLSEDNAYKVLERKFAQRQFG